MEMDLNSFQLIHTTEKSPVVWIIDNHIQPAYLNEEEVKKCNKCLIIPSCGHGHSTHGTKVFKFVSATSTTNAKINFLSVGGWNDVIDFLGVAQALEHAIIHSKDEYIVWANCSFTLPPSTDP